MSAITIPGPSLLYVKWGCRRCGHRDGIARTTVPVDETLDRTIVAQMLASLRRKLVRVHQRGQHCIAVPDDFTIEAYTGRDRRAIDVKRI